MWNISPINRRQQGGLRRLGVACVTLLALCAADTAWARPVAWLKNVKGTVQVRAGSAARFKTAREHQPLSLGDTVRTGARSRTDVALANGSRVIILQKMRVNVTRQWLNPVRAQPRKTKPQLKRRR
jgi:hypothetical protein